MRIPIWMLLLAAVSYADQPSAIALRNARVVTVSGPAIERGTVVLRNGLIEAVGENAAIPADAWVIEGQGLTAYPGLIDALSTAGIPEPAPAAPAAAPVTATRGRSTAAVRAPSTGVPRGPEDRPRTTSWLRAADQFEPSDRRFEEARSAGFTTAAIYPTAGLLAGHGAVVNLAGGKRARMVLSSPAGQYCAFSYARGSEFPNSLLGSLAYVRQVYLDAANYKLEKAAWDARAPGARRPDYDRALEGLLESPRLLLPAASDVEIERILRFGAGLHTPFAIYGAQEAFRDPARIARAGVPVLLSLKWPERSRDGDPDRAVSLRTLELWDRAPSSAAALAKAGVKFAFYTDGAAVRDLPRLMQRALAAGLAPADAIRAFTLGAAEIYGLADRLGSIEKGKIANLVVTEGNLFGEKTRVKHIFVDGVQYEPAPQQQGGDQ
jgi:hypothetical protein